jgi:hypothetical protein
VERSKDKQHNVQERHVERLGLSTSLGLWLVYYIDCPKINTLPSKFKIKEKYEPRFLQGFGALEKDTPTKKRMEGGKKKGKKQTLEFALKM